MTQSPENGQKPHFGRNFDHFGHFSANFFSSKNGLRHFKSFIVVDAKNQKNPMVGSMRTWSDRQTDGAGYIRT